MTGDGTGEEEQERPFLRVVRGDATPEEIAAIVAVLAAARPSGRPAPRRTPEWSAPHRKLRTPVAAGPGAWRASGLPR